MLTLSGQSSRYCDGVSRRSFIKIGGLAMGGLSLPQLLEAEEQAGRGKSNKSVIMVYLSGGLSHHDTFDLKPDAPKEIRGEFKPISTRTPGFFVGEHLPLLASSSEKYAIIRSIVGLRDEHSSFQNLTGYPMDQAHREGKPNFSSVVSRVLGPRDQVVPPYVDLSPTMQHRPYNTPGPGILGQGFAAAKVDGDDLKLFSQHSVTAERFTHRRDMLSAFDRFRREVDATSVQGMESQYDRALAVLTSDKLAKAIDLENEDPRVRDRYGRGSKQHLGDGAPMWNDQLLIARRLVEAGARCVTVAYGFWDTHGNNFPYLKEHLPLFDRGISALVEDIYQRGLDRDVTVVVWGEFGRTPKVNKDGGRDHWAPVGSALLAGGGMHVGQTIGATDKQGAYAAAWPIHYLDVLATIYHNLGIDPNGFIKDKTDRPTSILPMTAQPIERLVS